MALVWYGDFQLAVQVLRRQRFLVLENVLQGAFGDDFAAVHARADAHVDDVVGRADGVFIVLNDQHAVADVAQVFQRFDQTVIIALMQADRRFVEHIHDARQTGANLRREADALCFTARQRVGAAVQRQVIEAHIVEELQTRNDFFHDAVGDFLLGARQFQLFKKFQRLAQRFSRHFIDGALLLAGADLDEARFHAQARAIA